MKKRPLHQLIFGCILVFMQLIIYTDGEFGYRNSGDIVSDLGFLLGYNLIGITGLLFIILYLRNNKKD